MLDCLAASGAASVSGSWVRLYINDEPFGLFLMIDDASTHFIDDVLHAGDSSYAYTGPTYKGNALSEIEEANLVYVDERPSSYSEDIYMNEDKGVSNKTMNAMEPLIGFMHQLTATNNISQLMNPTHTLIHMAYNYLTGSWDGFRYQASNYLNLNLKSNQWTLMTYDFDRTFGSSVPNKTKWIAMSVQEFHQARNSLPSKRPLQTTLYNNYQAELRDILRTLVKRLFKPSVMQPRLKAWVAMLKEEIAWTRSLPPPSAKGTTTHWTLHDFEPNMLNTRLDADDRTIVGILEWITGKSQAVRQQLGSNDTDDLPPLGPYTGGRYGDGAATQTTQLIARPTTATAAASTMTDSTTPKKDDSSSSSVLSFLSPFTFTLVTLATTIILSFL